MNEQTNQTIHPNNQLNNTKMKNLDLLHEALTLNENQEIERLIKQVITSNQERANKRFDIYDYCAPKDDIHDALKGVYHSNGFKVVTDSYLLIKVKEGYNSEYEGKIIDKKGAVIEAKFPDYGCVIPTDESLIYKPFPFSRILEIEKEFKLDKKASKFFAGYINFSGVLLSVPLLAKMARFALFYGFTEIGISEPNRAIKIGKGYETTGILMPITKPDPVNSKEYYL